MKKLEFAAVPDISNHEVLFATRKPPVVDPIMLGELDRRFSEYLDSVPAMHALAPLSHLLMPHLDVLYAFYDSESALVKSTLKTVRTIEKRRCPYCGRPNPTTLDHFFPRSKYKELSFFSKNLIPCCAVCNQKKRNDVWDKDGVRLFLNPYFDDFLTTEFVEVQIQPDPEFSFEVPLFKFVFSHPHLSTEQRQTCTYHFSTLGVFELIREELASKFRVLRRRLSSRLSRGGLAIDEVRRELQDEEHAETQENGVNCWESLFLRSVFRDDAVLEYVTSVPYTPTVYTPF